MKKINIFLMCFLGLITSYYALADQYCESYPATDRSDNGANGFIRMRDPGNVYTLRGVYQKTRVDTQTIFMPKVSFYYDKNPANYAFYNSIGYNLTPFATAHARFFNGHTSSSYSFSELGNHKIYASIFATGGISDVTWTCTADLPAETCQASCPMWSDVERADNGCVQDVTYNNATEVLCAVKNFIVQTEPKINITDIAIADSSVTISTGLTVDINAKVYAEGMQPTIRYSYKNMDYPSIEGNYTTTDTSKTFNPIFRGQYKITVSVYDGVYTSNTASQTVSYPWGKVPRECLSCGIPK